MAVRFRMIREKRDLTQQKVADIIGVSKTNYNYFENEERFIPLKHLNNYCNEFNTSMDYIFFLSENNTTDKEISKLDRVLVGKRIREIREMKGLSQFKLAKLLNTTQSTISSYENGKTLILTSFLYGMCKKLNVSMDYISGRSNIINEIEIKNK